MCFNITVTFICETHHLLPTSQTPYSLTSITPEFLAVNELAVKWNAYTLQSGIHCY